MMLRREVFEKAGRFSEDYFMYAEDLDLCYKVGRAGFRNYYVGEVAMIHHGSKSSQHRADQWATTMKFKAVQHFCEKRRGRLYGLMYRNAMGCSAIGRLLLIALAFPFAGIRFEKRSLQAASAKWNAVLKWALGLEKAGFEAAESC